MGSDVAEAQIDDLSDAEIDVLVEIYDDKRGPGRDPGPGHRQFTMKGIVGQGGGSVVLKVEQGHEVRR